MKTTRETPKLRRWALCACVASSAAASASLSVTGSSPPPAAIRASSSLSSIADVIDRAAGRGAEIGRFVSAVASEARSLPSSWASEGRRRWTDISDDDGAAAAAAARGERGRRRRRTRRGRRASAADFGSGGGGGEGERRRRRLVVGGAEARPGRFPYVASLQLEEAIDNGDGTSQASSLGGGGGEGGATEVLDEHTCGGTLIAMDVLLTAAHCAYDELSHRGGSEGDDGSSPPSSSSVALPKQLFYGADVGAHNLFYARETAAGINGTEDGDDYDEGMDNLLFEWLVLHPKYTGYRPKDARATSLQHDVMLVKLYGGSDQPPVRLHRPTAADDGGSASVSESASESATVRPPAPGEEMTVVGWGDTDPDPENQQVSPLLQVATVRYIPNDECNTSAGYAITSLLGTGESASGSGGGDGDGDGAQQQQYVTYAGTITPDMMCATGGDGSGGDDDPSSSRLGDACQGDSGGGLFRLGADPDGGEDVQMGVISWGLGCGDSNFPGVYSRIAEHYEWITEQVCELSDDPPAYFGCDRKPLPPEGGAAQLVDIVVVIQFDAFRSETAWVLESVPDFKNVAFRPFGTYRSGNANVDLNNVARETVAVRAGRFYMLSVLDEYADGFCCQSGSGYFRVEQSAEESGGGDGGGGGGDLVETTPGILWSSHALRRAFYVPLPGEDRPAPVYVTIVVTLGAGADPDRFLLVALENTEHEAFLLYSVRPFSFAGDGPHRHVAAGTSGLTMIFAAPVLGPEHRRQRYMVVAYDDNADDFSSTAGTTGGGGGKASVEVYLGNIDPDNLLVAQGGDYGRKNHVSRVFTLFGEDETENFPTSSNDTPGVYEDFSFGPAANSAAFSVGRKGSWVAGCCWMLLIVFLSFP